MLSSPTPRGCILPPRPFLLAARRVSLPWPRCSPAPTAAWCSWRTRELFAAASCNRTCTLYCVHTKKCNKVLLFWDPKTPVGFDLFCLWKTCCRLFLIQKMFVSRGGCPFTTPELASARSWWGRRVPDGQLIQESGEQVGSRSWPGRACEPRNQCADPAESVLSRC